ncbi:hypothetical protein KIL84_018919 [Mauremys mutica]|uniref:Uncharacterized protein n=1 Tax=Mauremys mutica TaxID=74926 RepID=A0A9D3XVS4_9SAUR|nr:hypothetical protein KIL84_018919 [Mauremys mutica]
MKDAPMHMLVSFAHQRKGSFILPDIVGWFILCLCGTKLIRSLPCRQQMFNLVCLTANAVAAMWSRSWGQVLADNCGLFHAVGIRLVRVKEHCLGSEAIASIELRWAPKEVQLLHCC